MYYSCYSLYVFIIWWFYRENNWKSNDAKRSEPLHGCNIIADNTTLGSSTDINGYFTIFNIPPGFYSIRTQMIGYGEMIYTDVEVNIDLTTTLEFFLNMEDS